MSKKIKFKCVMVSVDVAVICVLVRFVASVVAVVDVVVVVVVIVVVVVGVVFWPDGVGRAKGLDVPARAQDGADKAARQRAGAGDTRGEGQGQKREAQPRAKGGQREGSERAQEAPTRVRSQSNSPQEL